MAKNSETGKCGFHQVRSSRDECRLPTPQRFARSLPGAAARNVPRNRIRVDYFNSPRPDGARQCGLATSIWASNHKERRHSNWHSLDGSGALAVRRPQNPVSVFGPRNMGAILSDAVECSARFKLSREVRLDPFAPVLRTPRQVRRWRALLRMLPHAFHLICEVCDIQSAVADLTGKGTFKKDFVAFTAGKSICAGWLPRHCRSSSRGCKCVAEQESERLELNRGQLVLRM